MASVKLKDRVIFLDVVRVLAIYMVMVTHSTELFYISATGEIAIADGDGFWVNLINSAVRSCVPLFVVVSGYLLLPISGDPSSFYKKRIPKIFIPFLIWSVIYVVLPLVWGGTDLAAVQSGLTRLLYNFNWSSGHLWFMYMLLGVYLFMPIISPWLKECSKGFEQAFLGIWLFTTLYHYIIQYIPDHMMLGESFWNEFSAIWYFSGYIGYVVLGHYIRTYVHWNRATCFRVGLGLYVIGYAVTYLVFDTKMVTADSLKGLELSWRFCTFNVALMTTGVFLMLKDISIKPGRVVPLIFDLSKFSFGIYLVHLLILPFVSRLIGQAISTPVTILLISLITFVASYLLVKALSYLPKSEYLVST